MIDLQPNWPVALATFYGEVTSHDLITADDMLTAIAERIIDSETYAILDCRQARLALATLESLLKLSPEIDLRLLAIGDFPAGESVFIPTYPTLEAALVHIEQALTLQPA
jgi:hypothetical protein